MTASTAAPSYDCTILKAAKGKRLCKLFTDPNEPPQDYDAGRLFTASEREYATFGEFVAALASLGSDECLIRGRVCDGARPVVEAGEPVRRLKYDDVNDAGELMARAAFKARKRRWLVCDVDESETPFDVKRPKASVQAWRRNLPAELRNAEAAFFLSAKSHQSKTVRGKLVVALARPMGDVEAAAHAKSLDFDSSVCGTVSINYFAAPIFEGCADPLAKHRGPILFEGRPARLPRIDAAADRSEREQTLGPRERASRELPPLSKRMRRIATPGLRARWLEGDRIETNAALHLCGWLLGKGVPKDEIGSLIAHLDADEPSRAKRQEHRRILNNARAIEGPGEFKEWAGDAFASVDRAVNRDPVTEGYVKRSKRAAQEADADDVDTEDDGPRYRAGNDLGNVLGDPISFATADEPIHYFCEGLCLTASNGKISVIAGQPGSGKGPLANHLAVCFALGLPAFGAHQCEELPVMLLDCEGSRLTKRRIARMCRALGRKPAELDGRLVMYDASRLDLTEADALHKIREVVEERGIKVVILDSYTTGMMRAGVDSNSPQYAELAQKLGELDVCVIAVAHANKASARNGEPRLADISGTGALGALSQTALMVWHPDEDDKSMVRIACGRAPETGFVPIDVRFEDRNEGDALAVERVVEADNGDRNVPGKRESAAMARAMATASKHADRVVDLLKRSDRNRQGMTGFKIRGALAISGSTWGDVRDELLRREAVEEYTLPSDSSVVVRLPKKQRDDGDAKPAPRKPKSGEYQGVQPERKKGDK